jgi:hypothetical protein
MKNAIAEILFYSRLIARKWFLWLFVFLDIVTLITQLFYPSLRLTQLIFFIITVVGFFWAGYRVYHDLAVQLPAQPSKPPPYELLPLSFNISLGQDIPHVDVWLYIVNYQPRDLLLQSIQLTRFNLSCGPILENISTEGELHVPSKQSKRVLCRRTLIEAEVRAIVREQMLIGNASVIAIIKASMNRRKLHQVKSEFNVNGQITGAPSTS